MEEYQKEKLKKSICSSVASEPQGITNEELSIFLTQLK
jgi:hypothetical protein